MADFYTNSKEENVIGNVIRSFGIEESEFPKYNVIRIALAWALNAKKIPLHSTQWNEKQLKGDKGKEYHLAQITNKGKGKEDFDLLVRALIYIKHKDELDRDKINIFEDEKNYLSILAHYIKRGFYELDNSYKAKDCIYQWCLDNLNLNITNSQSLSMQENAQEGEYFSKLKNYFYKNGIEIKCVNEYESYRHHICKIELTQSTKIAAFKTKAKYLKNEFGWEVLVESISGMQRGFNIQIAKPDNEWQRLGLNEFKKGLKSFQKEEFKLGIYAGDDIDKMPFAFDLAKTPHLLVAGTTGSGKTSFLKNIITCLLQNQGIEIFIIDPKFSSFAEFKNMENVRILSTEEASVYIEDLITEMENRYKRKANGESFDNMPYTILIVDELNDLIMQNKECNKTLARIAQKGRECKIHLILGSQRPDATTFDGNLRSNIPSRIALKVQKASESKIILDESGAEKLLGSGDMLVKLNDMPSPKHILAPYLENEEVENLIKSI